MNTISDEILQKCDTIKDLLDLATTEKSTGKKLVYSEIGSSDGNYLSFRSRYNSFKEVISNELPEFTTEEILKYHAYKNKLEKIYDWYGYYYLLAAMEFEFKKSRK